MLLTSELLNRRFVLIVLAVPALPSAAQTPALQVAAASSLAGMDQPWTGRPDQQPSRAWDDRQMVRVRAAMRSPTPENAKTPTRRSDHSATTDPRTVMSNAMRAKPRIAKTSTGR